MKIGIVGPGGIAHKFAEAVAQVPDVTITAVMARNPAHAQTFVEQYNIPNIYDELDEFLKVADIDAVYIALINPLHFQTAKQAILAGKSVLCEKPMSLQAAQVAELTALAREKHVLLMEGIWTLFLPCIQKAKAWIKAGRIGKLKYISSSFSFYTDVDAHSRLFDKAKGGGAAYDVGIYCLAFSLFMSGQAVKKFSSATYTGKTGVDEMGSALIGFADDSFAECSFGVQANMDQSGWIYGEQGKIQLPDFWRATTVKLFNHDDQLVDEFSEAQDNGFVYEIAQFKQAKAQGEIEVEPVLHALSLECAKMLDAIVSD
ncbi:MAG: Gfo/Idh/MocA family oxidoreductase [Lactobacillaceae bacterium]|jgi:predicted dehydrogenase|nr:Gfo/Idh/MocA family oxidoreductase [Lactobacillaceae bacterium]